MNNMIINSPLIEGKISLQRGKVVKISIVAYEHPLGMPARFCIGLVPAVSLSKQLTSVGIQSVIRLIDPSHIANHCNGWGAKESNFKNVITEFLNTHKVDFFFDGAEPMNEDHLSVLGEIGEDLTSSVDSGIIDMVQRITESGRKHGGSVGAKNALLYMAAHPFSWLDMHHPHVWKRQYSEERHQYVNLMSKPEARFTLVRKFLQTKRPDLVSKVSPADHYMKVCNTPCYIPIEDEPTFGELLERGNDWCLGRYEEIKKQSENHRRALRDFETLLSFQTESATRFNYPKSE